MINQTPNYNAELTDNLPQPREQSNGLYNMFEPGCNSGTVPLQCSYSLNNILNVDFGYSL